MQIFDAYQPLNPGEDDGHHSGVPDLPAEHPRMLSG